MTTTTTDALELDLTELREAAARDVSLCVVECDAGVEDEVGTAFISAALPSDNARRSDGYVAAMASGSWKVEEIDEQIIAPSNRAPLVRNVIVVQSADAMTSAARDRLLTTIEEPASRTSFCFLVRDLSTLSATIRGRAGAMVRVHASGEVILQRLVEAGVEPEALTAWAPDWGGYLGLLTGLEPIAAAALLAGAGAWEDPAPMSRGAEIVAVLESTGTTPEAKRRARRLTGALLGAIETNVARAVREGRVGPKEAEIVLKSLAGARENLTYNSSLGLVLGRGLAGQG